MRTYTQGFLNHLTTLETSLARVSRVHSYHLMSGTFSLGFKKIEKQTPRGIVNAFRKVMVFSHPTHVQMFNANMLVLFCIGLGSFEEKVSTLTLDFQMRLGNVLCCFLSSMGTFLTTAQGALLASKCFLRGAVVARILNCLPLRVSQEGLETNIYANIGMLAGAGEVFVLRLSLAHNEGIPMPISTQNKVGSFWGTFKRTVQFDLERLAQLGRNDEMFPVFMQIAILPILTQLDGVPAMRPFETRKTALDTKFFGGEKTFEGLAQPISKSLNGGRRDMFTPTTFKCSR